MLSDAPGANGKLDKVRAHLAAEGFTAEEIEKIVAIKMVIKKGQRQLPLAVPATAAAMIAFFDGRSDEQLEMDMIKGIHNDGGPYGPAGMYERLLVEHGVEATVAARAAEALAVKVGHRITAIRMSVVATVTAKTRIAPPSPRRLTRRCTETPAFVAVALPRRCQRGGSRSRRPGWSFVSGKISRSIMSPDWWRRLIFGWTTRADVAAGRSGVRRDRARGWKQGH